MPCALSKRNYTSIFNARAPRSSLTIMYPFPHPALVLHSQSMWYCAVAHSITIRYKQFENEARSHPTSPTNHPAKAEPSAPATRPPGGETKWSALSTTAPPPPSAKKICLCLCAIMLLHQPPHRTSSTILSSIFSPRMSQVLCAWCSAPPSEH